MPFITEEIWQALPHDGEALMVASYPEFTESLSFPEDEAAFETVMSAIKAVRSRRADMNVPPSKKAHLIIVTDKKETFESGIVYISKLAYAEKVDVTDTAPADADGYVSVVTNDARMFMPLAELVDIQKEIERIEKEIKKAESELQRAEGKLSNEKFTAKAPEAVVNAEREKAEAAKALIANLQETLKSLK